MDEAGSPILEWGHTIEALNKLDAGVPEQVPPRLLAMLPGQAERLFRPCRLLRPNRLFAMS